MAQGDLFVAVFVDIVDDLRGQLAGVVDGDSVIVRLHFPEDLHQQHHHQGL